MPGGNKEAYEQVKYYLELIAAKDKNGKACCAYISAGGSGHFVKMVHNAIEYAEMQLLSEVYDIMRNGFDLSPDAIANEFSEWNQTELNSYLLEITITILQTRENKEWLLDKILDVASSKGTGSWAVASAAELGVPAGMMTAALYARFLSAEKALRVKAGEVFQNERKAFHVSMNELKGAYTLARIINHYQGFELIKGAAKKYSWGIQLNELARIWTNGCIIRSTLMEQFPEVVAESEHLLLHPTIRLQIQQRKKALTKVGIESLQAGFAVPVLTEALNFLNGIGTKDSAMNLIQAQRDYFGAHTYQRTDDVDRSAHHTEWKKKEA
jgi:6-phosphogluconate dehydrogenase